jgi:hypothetical protein
VGYCRFEREGGLRLVFRDRHVLGLRCVAGTDGLSGGA